MDDYGKYLNRQMKDPAFRAEREKTRAEFSVTRALIEARIARNITQEQLAELSGVRQSNISRIENGSCSPTVATLEQLAEGMGKKLKIEFV